MVAPLPKILCLGIKIISNWKAVKIQQVQEKLFSDPYNCLQRIKTCPRKKVITVDNRSMIGTRPHRWGGAQQGLFDRSPLGRVVSERPSKPLMNTGSSVNFLWIAVLPSTFPHPYRLLLSSVGRICTHLVLPDRLGIAMSVWPPCAYAIKCDFLLLVSLVSVWVLVWLNGPWGTEYSYSSTTAVHLPKVFFQTGV